LTKIPQSPNSPKFFPEIFFQQWGTLLKKGGRGIDNPKGKILGIILIPKHV